jgi:hypothetical protein
VSRLGGFIDAIEIHYFLVTEGDLAQINFNVSQKKKECLIKVKINRTTIENPLSSSTTNFCCWAVQSGVCSILARSNRPALDA